MVAKKLFLFFLASSLCCHAAFSQVNKPIIASLGKVKLEFNVSENGQPSYAVFFEGKPVVLPSSLGFQLSDGLSQQWNGHVQFKYLSDKKPPFCIFERWQNRLNII